MYICAQSKLHHNKSREGLHEEAKPHDKESMDMFECAGWLHITIDEVEAIALVKLQHEDDHIPYWCIDVPDDVCEYVAKNSDFTPTQVDHHQESRFEFTKFKKYSSGMRSSSNILALPSQ